jgi:hypothetical protein
LVEGVGPSLEYITKEPRSHLRMELVPVPSLPLWPSDARFSIMKSGSGLREPSPIDATSVSGGSDVFFGAGFFSPGRGRKISPPIHRKTTQQSVVLVETDRGTGRQYRRRHDAWTRYCRLVTDACLSLLDFLPPVVCSSSIVLIEKGSSSDCEGRLQKTRQQHEPQSHADFGGYIEG